MMPSINDVSAETVNPKSSLQVTDWEISDIWRLSGTEKELSQGLIMFSSVYEKQGGRTYRNICVKPKKLQTYEIGDKDISMSARGWFLARAIAAPLLYPLFSLYVIAKRIFHRICRSDATYTFTARLLDTGKDLLRILGVPFITTWITCACLFGIIDPLNGMKLTATGERSLFAEMDGKDCLFKVLQPIPENENSLF